ncbi:UDP-glycosyltransferase 87A1 [Morella rubra]|uniref:UDP-glycosyltransferase 87A1 n=1 Tax=Morella rubra TaxID=262757 RepID=A0A6A1UPI9_9ROSI|nr:UDP-glycosyltransferase 87A1 [Morella rubra]
MDAARKDASPVCHVVAMPYPGRGHINPMMNLCKLLAARSPEHILVSFVITEEWLGFIGSEPKPDNIRFSTVPNVIPSESGRGKDFPGFLEAVNTKMEAPFVELLDRLEPPVTAIAADTYLVWATGVGNRRNIPVVSLWTMSATVFSIFHHFELLERNRHFPVEVSERGDEIVDYIPGASAIRLSDLPTIFYGDGRRVLHRALEAVSLASKAQYLLFSSVHEFEARVIDNLKEKFPFSVYAVGPTIPYFELQKNASVGLNELNYLQWLDCQPTSSVLYISLGSFLSVSNAQMDEIANGVRDSGVRFLWVSRCDTARFKDGCGDMGLVVPWCDQLKVLCHPSIGGFWTHCGWNSTLEALFAGVPLLTFPIFWDQVPNSKQIVEDWKAGWRVRKDLGAGNFVPRGEISELLKRFMDEKCKEGNEVRQAVKQLQKTCQRAIAKGGSSERNLDAFIRDISEAHGNL